MLVLTRKRDEEIKIGNDIVIRVMKTAKGSVKIGIDAPPSVRVLRGEVATADALEFTECVEFYGDEQFEECSIESLLVQN